VDSDSGTVPESHRGEGSSSSRGITLTSSTKLVNSPYHLLTDHPDARRQRPSVSPPYYKLNQMTEAEAISFATLHLEGEAHEWWYHGLVTLGHDHITSYREFIERLMDRFDRRDPEIHFRDLAQLRQTGTAKAFISEFQRVAVAVTDISEPRLVMLFTEGLTEPLRGWVKAYHPHSL
jgi:hypothetical protein